MLMHSLYILCKTYKATICIICEKSVVTRQAIYKFWPILNFVMRLRMQPAFCVS